MNAKKKEVEALKKAWAGRKQDISIRLSTWNWSGRKTAAVLNEAGDLERRAAANAHPVGTELKKNLDDCAVVFQGPGRWVALNSTVHNAARDVLVMLGKHS